MAVNGRVPSILASGSTIIVVVVLPRGFSCELFLPSFFSVSWFVCSGLGISRNHRLDQYEPRVK